MLKLFGLLLALVAAMIAPPAEAMKFQLLQTANGQRLVYASGIIVPGDARRLAAALNLATRDRNHTKDIVLDSPGGSVFEALAMADIMDDVGVSTIVGPGSLCGSACAEVLFVSGKYRSIEGDGLLAIHSCYDIDDGQPMEDCNGLIAAHAQYEGVSGDAMMAFQNAAGPDSALMFDSASAACFNFTRRPGAAPVRSPGACLDTVAHGRGHAHHRN